MNRKIRIIGAAAIAAVIGAACSTNADNTAAAGGPASTAASSSMDMTSMGTTAVDGPAATLRTGLSTLLQEHVYLAGIATGTAIQKGPKDPATAAALGALDENSVALSEAIGSVYGDAGAKTFLGLWRKHIGFFVDYTLGAATGDQKMAAKARKELDGYREDFGAFIESATGGILSKDAVASELKAHVDSLIAAIDAQAKGDPKAIELLKAAAAHMPMTADVLAGAIAQQYPDKFAS
jgi:hypothetical protein